MDSPSCYSDKSIFQKLADFLSQCIHAMAACWSKCRCIDLCIFHLQFIVKEGLALSYSLDRSKDKLIFRRMEEWCNGWCIAACSMQTADCACMQIIKRFGLLNLNKHLITLSTGPAPHSSHTDNMAEDLPKLESLQQQCSDSPLPQVASMSSVECSTPVTCGQDDTNLTGMWPFVALLVVKIGF